MDDFDDARSIAEKLTGKSRSKDDEISETTLRLYKRGREQFKELVLAEVEKLQETHMVGVETWRHGLDAEKRRDFDSKKKIKYQEMQKQLYEDAVKEQITPEELACITLIDKHKRHLEWDEPNELEEVRKFFQDVIEDIDDVPEVVMNWVFLGRRVQPTRTTKRRKSKK